jgi:hypothetical protein
MTAPRTPSGTNGTHGTPSRATHPLEVLTRQLLSIRAQSEAVVSACDIALVLMRQELQRAGVAPADPRDRGDRGGRAARRTFGHPPPAASSDDTTSDSAPVSPPDSTPSPR